MAKERSIRITCLDVDQSYAAPMTQNLRQTFYARPSFRFGEALWCHFLLQADVSTAARYSFFSIFLRYAGKASQNLRLWKSYFIGMCHGSVHVFGYGDKHGVFGIGMGGLPGLHFCDDSPFAYIFSGAGLWALYFCLRVVRGGKSDQVFLHTCRDMIGANFMNKASTAGLPDAYT